MKKSLNQKVILVVLFSTILLISDCSNQNSDYGYMYNTYYGQYNKAIDNGVTVIDISVKITKDTFLIKSNDEINQISTYKITADSANFVYIETEAKKFGDITINKFKYDKINSSLIIIGFQKDIDLILKTKKMIFEEKLAEYASFQLTTDISHLSANEKKMLPLLFNAAKIMDDIFWLEVIGNKDEFLNKIDDNQVRKFAQINYGPWEALNGNIPFIDGFGTKPAGVNFYPKDMTKEEFDKFESKDKISQYTIISRDKDGKLISIPYHVAFKKQIDSAAGLILQASKLADDIGLKKYLELRAKALLTDEYFESDLAWMDMKSNNIDFIAGPIENYEDALFGYKSAHESFVLIKDKEWSNKLSRFLKLLPELQKSLDIDIKYKKDMPGSNSDLGVYDAIYYAGDCNSGSKTIAINLPNDEKVSAIKGTRRLQLKNTMKAKFEKILLPISNILIDKDQRKYIKFEAFFENVMFHEIGHGLGIKNTINNKGTVRDALKEQYSAIEECKADIMGLYLITKLNEMGEFKDKDLMDNYTTFIAGIFRSVRFGAASAHGIANMLAFNYFEENKAFEINTKTNTYFVNFDLMKKAINSLTQKILIIQGNGDYNSAKQWIIEKGVINNTLKTDLKRIANASIPKDIIFEQGEEQLKIK